MLSGRHLATHVFHGCLKYIQQLENNTGLIPANAPIFEEPKNRRLKQRRLNSKKFQAALKGTKKPPVTTTTTGGFHIPEQP